MRADPTPTTMTGADVGSAPTVTRRGGRPKKGSASDVPPAADQAPAGKVIHLEERRAERQEAPTPEQAPADPDFDPVAAALAPAANGDAPASEPTPVNEAEVLKAIRDAGLDLQAAILLVADCASEEVLKGLIDDPRLEVAEAARRKLREGTRFTREEAAHFLEPQPDEPGAPARRRDPLADMPLEGGEAAEAAPVDHHPEVGRTRFIGSKVEDLRIPLDVEEQLRAGRELALMEKRIAAKEASIKAEKARLAAELAELKAERAELSLQVEEGMATRPTKLEIWAHYDRGEVEERIADTGRVYRRRPMRDDERQVKLLDAQEPIYTAPRDEDEPQEPDADPDEEIDDEDTGDDDSYEMEEVKIPGEGLDDEGDE